jgi:amino acid adenylation domain-containing protein
LTNMVSPESVTNYPSSIYSISPAKTPELESEVSLLHQFLERSASIRSDSPALQFVTGFGPTEVSGSTWSYAQVNDIGNRIASLLRRHGVKTLELVAICFEKCPEAIFAILGILKAGCTYVALDPKAPFSRKQYILKESRAQIILSAHRSTLYVTSQSQDPLDSGIVVLYLDEIKLDSIELDTYQVEIGPESLSYCLFTSGTTGNPKGCRITHENSVQAMKAFSLLFAPHWDQSSRWLQFAAYHFDVSVLEIFWSWSEGLCVVSASQDLLLSDLPGFIRRLEITHIDLTPSLATLLTPEDVPSLTRGVFITGGEALRQDILDKWGSAGVIHNGYGPTEVTIGCTMYPRVPANGRPSNIGWQFENVGAYVFKPDTQIPVLRGAPGELCVSGKLVGDGYLNDPVLTKMKFQILESGEKVYRTGDQVRMLCDNTFKFLGRDDEQIKLRGQRLEIDEINSVIKKTPGLRSVATYVLRHPAQSSKHIISFIISNESKETSAEIQLDTRTLTRSFVEETRKTCQSWLPPYMVPTFILPISHLPLTTNNKVARNDLRSFFNKLSLNQLQQLDSGKKPSRNLTREEAKIAEVVEATCKVSRKDVLPHSSLFQFLDSISVIGFAKALTKAGYASATVATILSSESV